MNKPMNFSAWGGRGQLGAPPAQQIQATLQQACALHQQGQLDQAARLYEAVLKAQPRNFDALHLLGVIAYQTQDCRRAVELITQALKVDRNHVPAYNHRGAAYAALKEYELALLNYDKAIALQPQAPEAWNNRANVRLAHGQLDAALADLDQALRLKPDYAEACHNRGNVLSELGRHAEAIASYQRAVDLKPAAHDMRRSLGMACLRSGEFARGWAHSEGRLPAWMAKEWLDTKDSPRWQGEDLAGRTILLRSEQGLGDTIQFARYVPPLVAQGAKVVLEVQKPLLSLLAGPMSAWEQVCLIAQGQALPAFDCYCPLMSLPLVFKTDLGHVPAPLPIQADAARIEKWQALLGERSRPRVGIVWRGNAAHVDDHRRSMRLQDLLPMLSDEIEWVSLHKDLRPQDEALLAQQPGVRHFGGQQEDFTDAAAMLKLVDLVVTVDTSMAHLAGSMGVPVWVLLAFNADWRWLLERNDSPWYPSARLLRQRASGDWPELIERVGQALRSTLLASG